MYADKIIISDKFKNRLIGYLESALIKNSHCVYVRGLQDVIHIVWINPDKLLESIAPIITNN